VLTVPAAAAAMSPAASPVVGVSVHDFVHDTLCDLEAVPGGVVYGAIKQETVRGALSRGEFPTMSCRHSGQLYLENRARGGPGELPADNFASSPAHCVS